MPPGDNKDRRDLQSIAIEIAGKDPVFCRTVFCLRTAGSTGVCGACRKKDEKHKARLKRRGQAAVDIWKFCEERKRRSTNA